MSLVYQIRNTKGDVTVTVTPLGINGSNKSIADSDVNFIGQGTTLWGESFNESLYRMIESFACPEKVGTPGVPINEERRPGDATKEIDANGNNVKIKKRHFFTKLIFFSLVFLYRH